VLMKNIQVFILKFLNMSHGLFKLLEYILLEVKDQIEDEEEEEIDLEEVQLIQVI